MGGVSQESRFTLTGPYYPNDVVTISVDGVSKSLTMNSSTDSGSNIENARSQLSSFITSNFSGVTVSSTGISSTTNDDGVSQESQLAFSGAFYPSDAVYVTVDGTQYAVIMNSSTDSGSNIVNALNQINSLISNSVPNVSTTSVDYNSYTIDVVFSDTDSHSISLSFYDSGNGSNQTAITGSVATSVAAASPTTSSFAYVDISFSDTAAHSLEISVTDNGYGSNQTAISGAVTELTSAIANSLPVAGDDSATVTAGETVQILVGANDSDSDGDLLTTTISVGPSKGSASVTDIYGDDYITYTANSDVSGADTITYTVSDGSGGTASATVDITVNASVNTAPVANNDTANAIIGQNTQINIGINDSDANGDDLTTTLLLAPLQGAAEIVDTNGTDYLIYTPFSSAVGTDNLAYIVSDGEGGTDTATVQINLFGQLANGSSIADVLNLVSLDSIAYGFKGNDLIVGNTGEDLIYGNHDLDTISGGSGSDTLYGGQNTGTPSVGEGTSSDVLRMRDGIEYLYGGAGNDIVYGNIGSDVLYGGTGADAIYGGQEADTLSGGSGNDTLYGNRGDDLMVGGAGGDTFVLSSTGTNTVSDFNASEGDLIDVADPSLVTISSDSGGNTVISSQGANTASIVLSNIDSQNFDTSYLI